MFEFFLFFLILYLYLYFIGIIWLKCKKLFVVVIDFGIIYFGYVFLLMSDWFKVLISNWIGGKVVILKIFIVFFFDVNKEIKVFGYEVED